MGHYREYLAGQGSTGGNGHRLWKVTVLSVSTNLQEGLDSLHLAADFSDGGSSDQTSTARNRR